jgi:hypothetical protein
MAKRSDPAKPRLPPPSRRALWGEFLKWSLGIPAVVLVGLAIIGGALWLTKGDMMWQAFSDMASALFWIGAIFLMYPVGLFIWVLELRDGLRARRDWDAMTPEVREAALAAQAEAEADAAKKVKRKTRKPA